MRHFCLKSGNHNVVIIQIYHYILIPPGVRDSRHTPNDPEEDSPEAVEDELCVGVALVGETELLP